MVEYNNNGGKMRRMMYLGLVIIIISLCLIGCATIVSGTSQVISVNSNVSGATVTLDGQPVGTTPFSGKVSKKANVLTVSKEGYETVNITMSKSFNAIFFGNIIIGGLLGSTTDLATGAMYEYAPNTFYADLKSKEQSQFDTDNEYQIRKFAMVNHSQIAIDSNNGEYMLALADLMNSKMERDEAIQNIKVALEISKGDQLSFGDELIKSFREYN
jgi:hypothetical protein